ncbi:hypothetical protein [Lactobacillus sp. UCMA15818]|uniref:hypothetical protein n=1 Tax=Lactobacillaceae TaxID=33958 RepID=UPI0025B0FB0B|nr:hypothetical protein [Lactobacillus sp. UCMA15818]MDN2452425.1 hypothetical protein [Lactobacillus sp. UCMA15818]
MASNSDSIFNLLSYLKRHKSNYQLLQNPYNNVIRLAISNKTPISDTDIYFPTNQLMVNRLADDFLAQHGELLDYYLDFEQINNPHFVEVWVTTAYIKDIQKYFLELSFE